MSYADMASAAMSAADQVRRDLAADAMGEVSADQVQALAEAVCLLAKIVMDYEDA